MPQPWSRPCPLGTIRTALPQPKRWGFFAVPSRGFDLDQVELTFKTASVYVCGAALLVCPF